MILVKPSFEILHMTERPLHLIERAGRTCYKSEDKINIDSAGKFSRMILKRGHDSVLEHATATVRIICDRGVSHEIVRHRLASYSQESTRYCNYKGGVEFIIPPWVTVADGTYEEGEKSAIKGQNKDNIGPETALWIKAMAQAESNYLNALNAGWKPEQARSLLPNSLKTEIIMTANLREWRHFFKLRTATTAHPQMREIAIPMLKAFAGEIPVIFNDLMETLANE
jgi:thymidylate synthase (FAD)